MEFRMEPAWIPPPPEGLPIRILNVLKADSGLLKEFFYLVSQAHSNPDVLLRELGIGR